ncbi:MAG: phosphotransferase, partial [Bryobacteraceae bacterium]
ADGAALLESIPAPTAANLPAGVSNELNAQVLRIGLLGRRTAELHLALASSSSNPDFAPEPFTPAYRESLESSLHDLTVRNFSLLRARSAGLPEAMRQTARATLELEENVLLTFHAALEKEIAAVRTRIHGDYHLGQVLSTGLDFMIIDFEGEPARSLSERRAKRSPLQDVAGMLRSFHYAARSATQAAANNMNHGARFAAPLKCFADLWQSAVSASFLEEYRKTAQAAPFLPAKPAEFDALLRLHLLEKAIYELGYELNNRPAWLAIPLGGIEELVGART